MVTGSWWPCGASEPRLGHPDPVRFGGRAPGASYERGEGGGAAPWEPECEAPYSNQLNMLEKQAMIALLAKQKEDSSHAKPY